MAVAAEEQAWSSNTEKERGRGKGGGGVVAKEWCIKWLHGGAEE